MIALTFALPDESRLFVAGLAGRSTLAGDGGRLLPVVVGECGAQRVMVIHTGVGESGAYRRRLETLLADGPRSGAADRPRMVISSGYAGGLQPEAAVGDLVLGENVSDAALLRRAGELLAGAPLRRGKLATVNAMAETAAAKRALGAATGTLAVDMETAWIAEVCAAARLPLLSLRVVSDAVHQTFPVPGSILFNARTQRPRYVALPAWLLAHPGRIAPFVRFVRELGPARARLTGALRAVVEGIGGAR